MRATESYAVKHKHHPDTLLHPLEKQGEGKNVVFEVMLRVLFSFWKSENAFTVH